MGNFRVIVDFVGLIEMIVMQILKKGPRIYHTGITV